MNKKIADMARMAEVMFGAEMEKDMEGLFGKDGQLDPYIQRAALLSLSMVIKSVVKPPTTQDIARVAFLLTHDIVEMDNMTYGQLADRMEKSLNEMQKAMHGVEAYLVWDAIQATKKMSINSNTPFI